MTTYTENTMNVFPYKSQTIQATFYAPAAAELKTILLYFHGGGFVFGSRTDLPQQYIERFAENGIGLLAVDYPLAPETKLETSLALTRQLMEWFVEDFLSRHHQASYFIMGRSAGAFLALSNSLYANHLSLKPLGVISLYGYYQLNDASFTVPSRHYLQYPKVSDKIVAGQIKEEPVLDAQDQNRYFVYMAARQKGDWLHTFLEDSKNLSELSIPKKDLKDLPPLFLAASTKDPDVPVRQSRQLANASSHNTTILHLVDVEEHDFDRTHENTLGIELYEHMTAWILELLNL